MFNRPSSRHEATGNAKNSDQLGALFLIVEPRSILDFLLVCPKNRHVYLRKE